MVIPYPVGSAMVIPYPYPHYFSGLAPRQLGNISESQFLYYRYYYIQYYPRFHSVCLSTTPGHPRLC